MAHKGKPGTDGVSAYITTTFNKLLQNEETHVESIGVMGEGKGSLHELYCLRRRSL